jgi:hypothetical protein
MLAKRILLAAAFAAAVTGCRDDREQPRIEMATEPVPTLTDGTQTAQFRDMIGTQISGDLFVTNFPDSVVIHVAIRGAGPNGPHGVRVQSGTCELPGEQLAVLEAVLTGALGNGRTETAIIEDPDRVRTGARVVAVYAPGAVPEVDRPVACAPMPAGY